MKKNLYSICLSLLTLLTITGCNDWIEGNSKSNLRTVHASFENGMTRVGIEQAHDSRDMITKWQESDNIHVIVSKGNNIVDIGNVPVHDISPDGKNCVFQYAVPDDLDPFGEGYNLLCFTSNCEPKIIDGDIFYNATLTRMPISQFKAPMMFDTYVKEDNSFGAFHHYGTYEIMHVTNNTDKDITFQLNDFNVATWWYKKGGLSIRQWDNSYITDLSYEEKPLSPPITIQAHGTDMVVSWYIPNGKTIDNAQIVANIDGQYVYSSNTISSKVTLCTGLAYHMYATWDGKELHFDNVSETEQLQLSTSTLTLTTGQQVTVEIISGSGSYEAVSNAKSVATVTVNGSKIIIKGVSPGSATITVKDNQTQERAKIAVTVTDSGTITPGTAIDLGLPSGTLWASCNVGATKPEDYGNYYAWGETEEKDYYYWDNYMCEDAECGTTNDPIYTWNGNKLYADIAGSKFDVATSKWGPSWHMPSSAQMDELSNECIWTWCDGEKTKYNGTSVRGYIISSKVNNNKIFLPAAGNYHKDRLIYKNESCLYWSSSQFDGAAFEGEAYYTNSNSAIGMDYNSKGTYVDLRFYGQTIRPVIDSTPQAYLTCPDDHHPHLIDLGLPSGTKWACCNVDDDHSKQSPTNYGSYYAWGETKEHEGLIYNWGTYTHCDGSSSTCHDIGANIAGTEYDVAHVKWGGVWQMPSIEQQHELFNNCTYTWKTMNGVKGRKFTSRTNGGSIFLPAAGNRDDSDLSGFGSYGYYWSSERHPSYSYRAYSFDFYSNYTVWNLHGCYGGLCVRPVSRN